MQDLGLGVCELGAGVDPVQLGAGCERSRERLPGGRVELERGECADHGPAEDRPVRLRYR